MQHEIAKLLGPHLQSLGMPFIRYYIVSKHQRRAQASDCSEPQQSARLLKFEPDCDLCAVQCQLIEEVGVAVVIIIIPVTNLGKEITGDLAA
jgi:hypothetical protein